MRKLSYDPLWKMLIDRKMTKTGLAEKAKISRGIITRMGKNEVVTLDAVIKICNAIDCDVYDVVEMKNAELVDVSDGDKAGNSFLCRK